jgi:hypothetical protein
VINYVTSGRLTRVRPDGEATVLRRALAFANGVVLAPDESYLLVTETIGYRILKFWLKGPARRGMGRLRDRDAGFPGQHQPVRFRTSVGVAARATGPVLDFLLPRHPILRPLVLRVPQRLQPQAEDVVWVQAYDLDGKLVHDIKTKHPRLSFITAAAETGGTVWLASPHHDVLGRIDLFD